VSQETIHLTFDRNFGKRRPIFKILFLTDLQLHGRPSHLTCVATLPYETCKLQVLPISTAYRIVRPQNSSC